MNGANIFASIVIGFCGGSLIKAVTGPVIEIPNFTEEEFTKERDVLIDALKSSEKDVSTAARRVERLLAYGVDHPYGEYVTAGTVNNIKLSDIQRFYDFRFRPNNAYLVIGGDIDFESVKKIRLAPS